MVLHQVIANLLLISITWSITASLFNTLFLSVISLFNILCNCLRLIDQKATWGILLLFISFSLFCLPFPCASLLHVKRLIYEQTLSHVWTVDLLLSSVEIRLSIVRFCLCEWQAVADFNLLKFLIFCKSAGHNYFKFPIIICIPLHHITPYF